MKTAVSIDAALLQEADRVARRSGLSRSKLFAIAIAEFLQRKKQEQMLQDLNAAYAEDMTAGEKRLLRQMKTTMHRIAEHE